MKNARRKKKLPPNKKLDDPKQQQQQPKRTVLKSEEESAKRTVLESLVEAFSLSSMEEASIAYAEAGGDPDKASEILMKGLSENNAEDPSSCSSTSYSSSYSGVSGSDVGSSSSGSSEGFLECFGGRNQKKKVVAATGTVSTVLGKGYVGRNCNRNKGFGSSGGGNEIIVEKEEAEQFMCSMLGKDSDLNLAVVRDVLCQCRYNIEKALDILLDLTASTNEQYRNYRHPDFKVDKIDDMRFLVDHNDNLIDRRSECASLSPDGELSDNFWSLGSYRNYADVLCSSKANDPISPGCTKYDLPQKVLESLFNIPKSSEHDKDTMDWRNVVQKMRSLGPGFAVSPHIAESQKPAYVKGDEYHMFREDAKQHWDTTKSYFQKAASAYSKGNRAYAAYLSEQGKEKTKLARRADTKASQDIFLARNRDIENVITIDLHGQHVKPAMRMLKLHLLFGSYIPSVQTLRVITGCGSHGVGKSKLKQSIVKLLEKEAIEWSEENRGTVLIKLSGWREFSFLDSDSDSDSN
ncbi:hypothetical protein Lal_00016965 [Lupinus albus]|uniref:Putative Smr domain-containing protein n=1 Tax=Lupinus albus TaxID=3870 RepID=A0A6A4P693_LUPAL|nr:putative Smr domain-containing protein [Lupinus albus]KAF1891334.1 hypothetical protein Lal_00016965 [Lupinus albus]